MRRTVDTIASRYIGSNGFSNGGMTPIARLDLGTQDGLTTDYRIQNATTPYVKQNVLCFLLEAPAFFMYLKNGHQLVATLKALMEGSQKIDGLDGTIKAEYVEVTAGAVEMQEAFSRTTRERSVPQHTWTERYGMAVTRFFQTWVMMGMGDPLTGVPGVVTLKSNEHLTAYGQAHTAYTLMPENISATCLYVEPDPTHKYPVKAFLITNMMPKETGDWTAASDRTSSPDKQEIQVSFTGMQEINAGVDNLALHILHAINQTGTFSYDRRAYIGDTYEPWTQDGGAVMPVVHGAAAVEPVLPGSDGKVGYHAQANAVATTEGAIHMKNGLGIRDPSEVGSR